MACPLTVQPRWLVGAMFLKGDPAPESRVFQDRFGVNR